MRYIYSTLGVLFVLLVSLNIKAQTPNTKSSIGVTGSNNTITVTQNNSTLSFNLGISSHIEQLTTILVSIPQIKKSIARTEGGINDLKRMVKELDGKIDKQFDFGAFTTKLVEVIEEKTLLKTELDKLREANKNADFDTVLKKANKYLVDADYENYKITLRTFAKVTQENIAKQQNNYVETKYLLSLRELNEYDLENALADINESISLFPETFDFLYTKSKILYKKSNFIESIKILQDLLNSNLDTERQWSIYEELFKNYMSLNDDFETAKCLNLLVEILNKNYKNDYEKIASTFYKKGVLAFRLSNHEESIVYFDSALAYTKQVPDKELAKSFFYFGKGQSLSFMDKPVEGLEYLDSARAIRERFSGKNTLDLAYIYNGIGTAYNRAGEFYKAIFYDSLAMELQRKFLGENSAKYGGSLSSLGFAYAMLKDSLQADKYLSQALNVCSIALGTNHPEYANVLFSYGHLYVGFRDFNKAITHYKKALDIQINTLNATDMELFYTYFSIGGTYYLMGIYSDSVSAYEKALNIALIKYGDKSPYAISVTKKLDKIKLKTMGAEVK